MDKSDQAGKADKRPFRARKTLIIVGGIVVVLVALYFVVTSSAFLKAMVLPRVGRGLNATVTADRVSLSPFSQLVLRGFNLRTTGTEPLLQADEALVRYHLWAILKGRLEVPEIRLVAPHLSIIQYTNGTSNLDPLLQSFTNKPATKQTKSQEPTYLALGHLSLENGTIQWVQNAANGSQQSANLNALNLQIDQLQNGQSGKASLAAELQYQLHPAPASGTATNSLLRAKLNGDWSFKLAPDLVPQSLTGSARCQVAEATGDWREAATLTGTVDCSLTPSNLENLALRFERAGKPLGQLRASGPLYLAKTEGRVKVEILSIDRQVLNLFGAAHGLDFGTTTINASNLVDLTQQGKVIAASGRLTGNQLAVRQKSTTTPAVDLAFDYQFTLNRDKENCLVQNLALSAKQGTNEILQASLDKPMNLAWGTAEKGYKDSGVHFSTKNLNLADWAFLLGNTISAGQLNLQGSILSAADGAQLTAQLDGQVNGFSGRWETNVISLSQLRCQLAGSLKEFHKLDLQSLQIQATDRDRTLLSCNSSASADLTGKDFRVRANLDVALPELLRQYPLPSIKATGGSVTFNGLLTQEGEKRNLSGTLSLNDFTGQSGGLQFQNYQAGLESDVQLQGDQVLIKRANLSVHQSFASGGAGNVSGVYDLKKQTAQLKLSGFDFNERALEPFLAPALAPRKLVSGGLTANGDVTYDPAGQSTVKADLNIANLVLKDPTGQWPNTALNAQFNVDGSMDQARQVRVNQLTANFSDGKNPGGRLQFGGTANLAVPSGDFTFQVADLNQIALRPWLDRYLAPKSLVSVNINGSGSGAYDARKDSTIKAGLSVTNLVVTEPGAPTTPKPKPLQARLDLDSSVSGTQADLRKLTLELPPTARAANRLDLQGHLAFARTNNVSGQFNLQADSLDATPLYELFGAKTQTNAPTPASAKPATPSATVAQREPPATTLPVQKVDLNLKVGSFYMGDINITNWQTTATLERNAVNVNPCQLTVNGGPLQAQASVNLGIPGYSYNFKLQADKIPLGPFVDTFTPNLKGQYQGNLAAQADIKGAGLTEADVQKNLTGQLSLSCTNANVALFSPRARTLLTPVAVVLQMQELLDSPVDAVSAQAQIGQGAVQVQQFTAYSQAYQAQSQGTITLAPVLTNSTLNLPVTLALRRSLAEKVNLVSANSPTGTTFVTLPSFVKITGTLGATKTEIDKGALAGISVKLLENVPGLAGSKAGNVLGGVGGLLSGDKSALTNQLQSLIPGFRGSTNQNILSPFTGAPPTTNRPALNNLLNPFLKPSASPPPAPAPSKANKPAVTNSVDIFKNLLNRW